MLGSSPGGIATGVLHNGPRNVREQMSPREMGRLTTGSNTVMLGFVVLWTVMRCDEKVLSAETLRTVLTLERKEVDEQTRGLGALLPDRQELRIHCEMVKVSDQAGL
jgi:hypothetical protein